MTTKLKKKSKKATKQTSGSAAKKSAKPVVMVTKELANTWVRNALAAATRAHSEELAHVRGARQADLNTMREKVRNADALATSLDVMRLKCVQLEQSCRVLRRILVGRAAAKISETVLQIRNDLYRWLPSNEDDTVGTDEVGSLLGEALGCARDQIGPDLREE